MAADEQAAARIQRAARRFLAQRAVGERLYTRLDDDVRGVLRPPARRVLCTARPEHVRSFVGLQRQFRAQQGARARRTSTPVGAGTADEDGGEGDMHALYAAIEAAGLYLPPPGCAPHADGADADADAELEHRHVASHSAPLQGSFSANSAAALSLDDLVELAAVLERHVALLRADLARERERQRVLAEQVERRERVAAELLARVGKHYRQAAQSKRTPRRAGGPAGLLGGTTS